MTVLETAFVLLDMGLWPVPITPIDDPRSVAPGKAPLGIKWGETKHTKETLTEVYTAFPTAGVGIKLGPEGRVVDIDVDDPVLGGPVVERMLGSKVIATLGWDSPRGPHKVFWYDERLEKYGKSIIKDHPNYPGLELRFGCPNNGSRVQIQSVVPPSLGSNRKPRVWNGINQIAFLPDAFFDDLETYLAEPVVKTTPGTAPVRAAKIQGTDVEQRAVAYLKKCEPSVSGQSGHNKAFKAACKVGPGFDLKEDVALRLIREVFNPTCQPPWSERELRHKIEDAYKVETRRGWLLNAERNGAAHAACGPAKEGDPEQKTVGRSGREYDHPLIVRGRDVEEKEVDWLIKDRIAYGFLNLFAGRTKIGKSFVTLDIAARLSVGGEIPLGKGECLDVQSCLIISEDSPEYVIKPRLVAAGADMDRFSFMSWQAMAMFTLADTEMLDDTYYEAGSPRVIVIDPPTNFLGGKDEHKNAEVRAVLMRVGIWALRHQVAVILITHCNKGTRKDMAAIDRIIGSIAWAATTRIAHIFGPHPDNPGEYVFLPVGSNIGEPIDGLSYQIVKGDDGRARVKWIGTVEISADDVMAGTATSKPRRIVASEWLIEKFREKLDWPSDELFRAAREAGVSRDAIFEAKAILNLPRARRSILMGGDTQYTWWVPPDWPQLEPK